MTLSPYEANKGDGNLVVVLLTKNADEAFAQALAVARCFPTFSEKSSARKATLDITCTRCQDSIDVFLSSGDSQGPSTLSDEYG